MTNCTYKIAAVVLGATDSIPLTKDEFEKIRIARKHVLFGLSLEEKFDLLLENYTDLEHELFDMALRHAVFPGSIEELLDTARHRVNRKVVNLLTSARLYLDQIRHEFSLIYGKDSDKTQMLVKATEQEYDSRLGYRFMEALRNYVQHISLPITSIKFPMTRDDEDKNHALIRFRVIPYVGVKYLRSDGNFKKAVIEDLQPLMDKHENIELIPFVREYIEALGRIHIIARKNCQDQVNAARDLIDSYRKKAKERFDKLSEGLAAIECDPRGSYKAIEYLTDRLINRLAELQKKNRHLDSFSCRYVSTK